MTSVYIIQQEPRVTKPNHSGDPADDLPWFSSVTNVENLVHLSGITSHRRQDFYADDNQKF